MPFEREMTKGNKKNKSSKNVKEVEEGHTQWNLIPLVKQKGKWNKSRYFYRPHHLCWSSWREPFEMFSLAFLKKIVCCKLATKA